ncbi:hypothetical protein C0J52_04617 [Blattella germanica]|nr:hypothetical protein C0J52_04617 [Blattella germanica]
MTEQINKKNGENTNEESENKSAERVSGILSHHDQGEKEDQEKMEKKTAAKKISFTSAAKSDSKHEKKVKLDVTIQDAAESDKSSVTEKDNEEEDDSKKTNEVNLKKRRISFAADKIGGVKKEIEQEEGSEPQEEISDENKEVETDKKKQVSVPENEDEDTGPPIGRQARRGILSPPPSITEVKHEDDTEKGEKEKDEDDDKQRGGIPLIPNLQYLRGLASGTEEKKEDEESQSSSGSEEAQPAPPKKLADIVLLIKSMEARKKRHLDIGEILAGIPIDISELERIGIICILEDCIDQLSIMGKTNNKPAMYCRLYHSLLETKYNNNVRFSERNKNKLDVDEIEGRVEASWDSKKIFKLQKDRNMSIYFISRAVLEMILQDTLDDLKSNESFKSLAEVMELENKKNNEEATLIREGKINKDEVARLRRALNEGIKESIAKINAKQEVIARLKVRNTLIWIINDMFTLQDQIQDTFFVNDLKYKYVSHWETAREEQNTIRLSESEETCETKLTDLRNHIDLESRCHVEVEAYLKLAISSLEDDIEKWMTRYDNELEDRSDEIQRLRAKRAEHYTELEELALTYQHHQNEIDAYLAHKEKKEAEAAHEEFINRMATKIQAWWRGVMVRRGLGPYRKKKKGKDKGKGKGKGGKKKKK